MNVDKKASFDKDIALLRARVQSLMEPAHAVSKQGRALMTAANADSLRVMSRAVEETRLARCLIFRNDRDETVALHVSAGRILKFVSPTTPSLCQNAPELCDKTLSGDTFVDVAACSTVLRKFTQGVRTLHVTSEFLTEESFSTIGISIDRLLSPERQDKVR